MKSRFILTDEMIFHAHAVTPVCPFCRQQSRSGPMGFYDLRVTCECGREYQVKKCKNGIMKYKWDLD